MVRNPLKRFISIEKAAQTDLRMSRLLLQAIGLHAVEAEQQEYQSFRTTINALLTKITEETPLEEILTAVGVATKAMYDYGFRTSQLIKAQHLELQALSRMLTETIIDLSPTAAHSMALREIDWSISKASSLEDIKDLQKRIADCLETIRTEITEGQGNARHKSMVDLPTATLENRLSDAADIAQQQLPFTDVIAGRSEAETAIRSSKQHGSHSLAAVFVVDRLRYVNSRFGNDIGNQIIALFERRLAGALLGEDRLFRWNESSFLALFETGEPEAKVRRRIEQMLLKRLIETFTINDRSVMLTISASWTVVLIAEISCDAVVSRVDSFVAQNSR
ncbi:MAG TPA: diguanylate cyclase [Terriglobales bacterium]|jgi:GGDEF domain-containing protein|nr:diguanylate cyclase [Terriglobales bacterium]